MENMITVFENEEFGAVRTATINSEPWFVRERCLPCAFSQEHEGRTSHA